MTMAFTSRLFMSLSILLMSPLAPVARADWWPNCSSNNGAGYGDSWFDSASSTTLAKNDPDLNDASICVVNGAAGNTQVGGGASSYPECTGNGGAGFGDSWYDSGSGKTLAKDAGDFNDGSICLVHTPASGDSQGQVGAPGSGFPYCLNNSGAGFGDSWHDDASNSLLAKDSYDLSDASICVVSSSSPAGDPGQAVLPTGGPLDLGAPGSSSYSVTDYGARLQKNKQRLLRAAQKVGASDQESTLIVAMAMLETTLMSRRQRDHTKDYTPSANCTMLNVNFDMLAHLGYSDNDFGSALNHRGGLSRTIGYLLSGFHSWGIQATLNFQRGGATGFGDGVSYGVWDYRNAIATIYAQILADPALKTDSRRVEVDLPGV